MIEDQYQQLSPGEPRMAAPFPEDSHAPQLHINPSPQTAEMEVHKHPHHVMHKKKWTEYLLEFFMIFFAVTAGFFAENIRENISEHTREKEYIHSLLMDLKSDTAMISKTISNNQRYGNDDSALLRLLQSPLKDAQTLQSIYSLYPQTEKFIVEINDPKTFEQLKNTGDIRLIRKQAVLDSMSSYYQKISRIAMYRDEIQSLLQTTYNLSDRIFDNYTFDSGSGTMPTLLTNDPILIKEYTNKLYHLTRDFKKYDRFLELLRNSTKNFIRTIEESYHIENE